MSPPTLVFADGRPPLALAGAELVLGRAADCALRLDDEGVAERQLRFARDGAGAIWAEALAPGVRVKGEPLVGRVLLAHGDVLALGAVELRFCAEGEPIDVTDVETAPAPKVAFDSDPQLPPLLGDDDDPRTTQMDRQEFEARLAAEAAARVQRKDPTPSPDAPPPLPPPPASEALLAPSLLPLPPPPPPQAVLVPQSAPELELPPPSRPPPIPSETQELTRPIEPPDAPTKLIDPPPSRPDPTTKPSLQPVAVPVRSSPLRRAIAFARAAAVGDARRVLLVDAGWAALAGAALGGFVLLGRAGLFGFALGLAAIAVVTRRSTARLTPPSAFSQPPALAGFRPSTIAVGAMRACLIVLAVLAAALALTGASGAILGGLVAGAALAKQAWLRATYASALRSWALATPPGRNADPTVAPPPIRTALLG